MYNYFSEAILVAVAVPCSVYIQRESRVGIFEFLKHTTSNILDYASLCGSFDACLSNHNPRTLVVVRSCVSSWLFMKDKRPPALAVGVNLQFSSPSRGSVVDRKDAHFVFRTLQRQHERTHSLLLAVLLTRSSHAANVDCPTS